MLLVGKKQSEINWIMRTGFENLRVYNLAEEIADLVWEVVSKWDYFAKDTVGKQLVNSADSTRPVK